MNMQGRELIIDLFAGGGGASTGIEAAVDLAVNHDPEAIAMHAANHPETQHLIEDVFSVNPYKVVSGRPVGLLWASPDCTHYSRAKGGKPVSKKIRGLAWVVVKWAKAIRPRVIILENVPEFREWGPLDDNNQPVKSKRGKTFLLWSNQLRGLGYQVQFRELSACDYGAPTIRKRLIMIARCDGQPIVWPEPTHGEAGNLFGLKPYRTAAECIDWSIPCPSIFERKKPLAENTLRRIARGLRKFVIDTPNPFIIGIDHQSSQSAQWDIQSPLRTITRENRFAVVTPYVTKFRTGATGHPLTDPMHTITAGSYIKRPAGAGHAMGLVMPYLTKYHGGESGKARGQKLDQPMYVQDTSNRFGLVSVFLTKFYGTNIGADMRGPVPTVTASGQHIGEVRAFLIKYYGCGDGQSLHDPMHTVTSKDRLGLVTVGGQPYRIADIGLRMLAPRELAAAQGFPAEYQLIGTKSSQVAKIGNSVCPPIARALVKANVHLEQSQEAKVG